MALLSVSLEIQVDEGICSMGGVNELPEEKYVPVLRCRPHELPWI
jgi:hypothetical protein